MCVLPGREGGGSFIYHSPWLLHVATNRRSSVKRETRSDAPYTPTYRRSISHRTRGPRWLSLAETLVCGSGWPPSVCPPRWKTQRDKERGNKCQKADCRSRKGGAHKKQSEQTCIFNSLHDSYQQQQTEAEAVNPASPAGGDLPPVQ